MTSRLKRGAFALGAAALLFAPAVASAVTQHPVGGQNTLIKDPKGIADPTKRSVNLLLKQSGGPATVGDPTVSGATLSIKTDAGSQCVSMPAVGWSPVSTIGWKFKGASGLGPVVSAQIKTTPSGVFLNKVVMNAKLAPINTLLQANSAAYNFRIGNGDIYCGTFGGTISKNDTSQFKAKLAPAPGSCGPSVCAVCGDGIQQVGEACDTGGVDTATCNGGTCKTSACGDGYTNAAAGEQCDSGGVDTATCVGSTCQTSSCGDGHVNAAAGEVCDPPGSAFGSGPPFDNGVCDACTSPSGAFLDPPLS